MKFRNIDFALRQQAEAKAHPDAFLDRLLALYGDAMTVSSFLVMSQAHTVLMPDRGWPYGLYELTPSINWARATLSVRRLDAWLLTAVRRGIR